MSTISEQVEPMGIKEVVLHRGRLFWRGDRHLAVSMPVSWARELSWSNGDVLELVLDVESGRVWLQPDTRPVEDDGGG